MLGPLPTVKNVLKTIANQTKNLEGFQFLEKFCICLVDSCTFFVCLSYVVVSCCMFLLSSGTPKKVTARDFTIYLFDTHISFYATFEEERKHVLLCLFLTPFPPKGKAFILVGQLINLRFIPCQFKTNAGGRNWPLSMPKSIVSRGR